MKKPLLLGALVAALGASAALVAAGGAPSATAARATAAAVDCSRTITLGFMGPTTGPAASIGQELRDFSILYAENWNDSGKKPKIDIVQGDTQFDPAQASTIAQQFVSNGNLLGVIGPGGSQEVLAVGRIFQRAGMAFSVASATRKSLTIGKTKVKGLFRIAAPDSVQAKSTTDYMLKRLHVKRVFVLDDQSAYSVPLAEAVSKILAHAGVKVSRSSVAQKQSDFSSVITDIPDGTDLIYLPIQFPAKMELLGQQLKEQGKKITLFASDAGYSPDFKIVGSYFSTFGPDVRTYGPAQKVLASYYRRHGKNAPLTTFGPLAYISGQVMVGAAVRACKDGSADRAEVLREMHKTSLKTSIIGEPVRYTADGDRIGGSFFTFKVTAKGPVTVR